MNALQQLEVLTALFLTVVNWFKCMDLKSNADLHHICAAFCFLFPLVSEAEVQKQAV